MAPAKTSPYTPRQIAQARARYTGRRHTGCVTSLPTGAATAGSWNAYARTVSVILIQTTRALGTAATLVFTAVMAAVPSARRPPRPSRDFVCGGLIAAIGGLLAGLFLLFWPMVAVNAVLVVGLLMALPVVAVLETTVPASRVRERRIAWLMRPQRPVDTEWQVGVHPLAEYMPGYVPPTTEWSNVCTKTSAASTALMSYARGELTIEGYEAELDRLLGLTPPAPTC